MSQNLFWLTQNYPFSPKNLCSSAQEILKVRNYRKLVRGRSWGMGAEVLNVVRVGEVLQALWDPCRKGNWSLSYYDRDISGTPCHNQRGKMVRAFQAGEATWPRVLCSGPPSLLQDWRRRNGDQYSQSHTLVCQEVKKLWLKFQSEWVHHNDGDGEIAPNASDERLRLSHREVGVENNHTSMHIKLRLLFYSMSPQNRQVKWINGSFQIGQLSLPDVDTFTRIIASDRIRFGFKTSKLWNSNNWDTLLCWRLMAHFRLAFQLGLW